MHLICCEDFGDLADPLNAWVLNGVRLWDTVKPMPFCHKTLSGIFFAFFFMPLLECEVPTFIAETVIHGK